MNDIELTHHGIKGQKWGVRRFQNEDGTLTEAGKKRYLENDYATNYRNLVTDIDKIGAKLVKKHPDLSLEFDDGDYENLSSYARKKYNENTSNLDELVRILNKLEDNNNAVVTDKALDKVNRNKTREVKVANKNTKGISTTLGLVAGAVGGLLLSRAIAKNMSFSPVDNPKSKTGKIYVDKYSGISLNKFKAQSALRMIGFGLVGSAVGNAVAKGINNARTAKNKTRIAEEEEYNKN